MAKMTSLNLLDSIIKKEGITQTLSLIKHLCQKRIQEPFDQWYWISEAISNLVINDLSRDYIKPTFTK